MKPTRLTAFAHWASQLRTEDGQPFKVLAHERKFLKEFFTGARETVVIMPKKNGKTSCVAALALYHLDTVDNAEVVIGAASRDQATILFKQAAGLVQRSGLTERFDVRPGYREIRRKTEDRHEMPGRIRVLAADSSTADGVIPTLALVDELHRHRSAELYGVFRDGLGPRGGQLITISTAGAGLDSPLGELRTKAHMLPGFTRKATYNHAVSPDRSFAFHEWCLTSEQDIKNLKLVKSVNPAPWHTVKSLRERRDSPSTTPAQWARFACGIWTESDEPWITGEEWLGLASKLPDLAGAECYGGLDLSATTDTTAFTLVFPLEESVAVRSFVFLPSEGLAKRISRDRVPYDTWAKDGHLILTPGTVVDYAFVKQTILEAASDYNLKMIGYDRWNSSQLITELQQEGLTLVPIAQTFRDMAQPMQEFRRLVLARKLLRGDNPMLNRHVMGMATVKDPAGNVRPAKHRSSGRIDAATALVTALGVMAAKAPPTESAYQDQLCSCPNRQPTPHIWRNGCLPRQVAV